MPADFDSFEEVPLPALLLVGGAVRGNRAAREMFQNRLPDAGSSLRELLAPKKVKLATRAGSATFRVLPDRSEEGHMVWLVQELSAAHDELEELRAQDAFKTQFLNMAAHELNTPLTPIRLQHHLLTTETIGVLTEQQKKAQEVIGRNLNRLSSLISDILDVARLESKALSVEMKPMDLARVVRESLESYAAPAKQVGVSLTAGIPDEAVVQGSAQRISQVVDNLISNAIKFTPEGGRVHVSLQHGDVTTFSVEDSGPGLTAAQMSLLFRPFSQVHAGDEHGGTGLGLYICKGILEAHGQTIQCESEGSGKGARFSFQMTNSNEIPVATTPRTALADRLRELI